MILKFLQEHPALAAIIALTVFAAIAFSTKGAGQGRNKKGEDWIFGLDKKKKTWLINKNEKVLYDVLSSTFPDAVIQCQVSFIQLFGSLTLSQIGKLGRYSLDFVVCDSQMRIIAAIELNGASHETDRQKKRDMDKKAALNQAGIPFFIYRNENIPSEKVLQKDIGALFYRKK